MFENILTTFSQTYFTTWGADKKIVPFSDVQMKAFFMMLDVDESGDLEAEEVLDVLSDRLTLGQSREK